MCVSFQRITRAKPSTSVQELPDFPEMRQYANPRPYLECVSNLFHACVITAGNINQNSDTHVTAIQLCTSQFLLLSVKLMTVRKNSSYLAREVKFLPFKSRMFDLAKRRDPQFLFFPVSYLQASRPIHKASAWWGGGGSYFHIL